MLEGAAWVLQEITNEENLLHKFTSSIVPPLPLFKWLFNFNQNSPFAHNGNFLPGFVFVRKWWVHKLSLLFSFFCRLEGGNSTSTSHHINLRFHCARRDTNTERGWVGGRTSWWRWKDQHHSIYLQDVGGRDPAGRGLIFIRMKSRGTVRRVASVATPAAEHRVNG